MLNLLLPGDGIVTKRTKYGFYVDMPYQNGIFIHYSDTLNESIFDEVNNVCENDKDKLKPDA